MSGTRLTPEVLVVGAGPAGLSAATHLAASGVDVLVVEREAESGGIPRHSDHTGYGLRDLRRLLRGPAYARELTARARDAGARLRTETMVTGWTPDRAALKLISPDGRHTVAAAATVLATGARERPRPARLVPGDRPAGILTTGELQQLVHLHSPRVGTRAVVVGSELVSWSAVLALRESGCRTVLMTTERAHGEAYAAVRAAGRLRYGVPVAVGTRLARVIGRGRVEAVEVVDSSGTRRRVACDTVVFTGDWVPDHELARLGDLELDAGTLGPVVDRGLRTSRPGVFAAGNVVHPVDTADVAALDGRHVAQQVRDWLAGPRTAPPPGLRVTAGDPFRWVAPGLLRRDDPPPARGRLLGWPERLVVAPVVSVTQNGRMLAERRLPWPAAPGRVFRIPAGLVRAADPEGGPLVVAAR